MDKIFSVDWHDLFIPSQSLAEMIVRGTIMYIVLFLIFRFGMKRQAGSVGIADLLVIVVIADAAQNAFTHDYQSLSEGIVLVLTIVFWDFFIDWLGFRFPALRSWLEPPPVLLVEDGKMLRRNMRREFITPEELDGHLRKAGVEDVSEVATAVMESNGEISVVPRDKGKARGKPGRSRRK